MQWLGKKEISAPLLPKVARVSLKTKAKKVKKSNHSITSFFPKKDAAADSGNDNDSEDDSEDFVDAEDDDGVDAEDDDGVDVEEDDDSKPAASNKVARVSLDSKSTDSNEDAGEYEHHVGVNSCAQTTSRTRQQTNFFAEYGKYGDSSDKGDSDGDDDEDADDDIIDLTMESED